MRRAPQSRADATTQCQLCRADFGRPSCEVPFSRRTHAGHSLRAILCRPMLTRDARSDSDGQNGFLSGCALWPVFGPVASHWAFFYTLGSAKDYRCAEMSSAMPTGGYQRPTAPISSTLVCRRPNSCGAAAETIRTGVSTHTWQHARSSNDATSAAAEMRLRRNRPDDAGLSTVQLLHTNARALRLPLHGTAATHKRARPRTPGDATAPPQTRRRATPRAGATGRPCRRTSRKTRGPTCPRACL